MKKTFTKKDFSSGDGMLTIVWGPPLWFTLHTITFNFPVNPTKEDINNYYAFFKTLKYVLPCKYCRDNLIKNMKVLKFSKKVFKDRETLSKWVYDLHNHVNVMLGKEKKHSFEDVKCMHENFRARCDLKKSTNDLKCDRKIIKKEETIKNIKEMGKKEKKTMKKEKGCTDSFYGIKTRCCLEFVPLDSKKKTIKVNPKCLVKKFTNTDN
jgi:hypothetical protein